MLAEYDIPFEETSVHCWAGGQGFPLIFMHGSGTGAYTLSNFKKVLEPLSYGFRVVAADLVGYGKSGRLEKEPYFDVEMWLRQIARLIDHVGEKRVGLIGHSLSGALVLKCAARDPRVAGALTTATFGVAAPRRAGSRGWVFPEDREKLRAQVQNTVLDKSLIDEEELDRRLEILGVPGYREYFSKMYGERQEVYVEKTALADAEIARIKCPVLMMHGAQDRSFPPEATSLHLARLIPQADVMVLGQCGHSVALEHPGKFIAAATQFFGAAA